jgi:hypothetical protein
MSSDPFDLLGLDRATATDADVRRAYAAKLKVTRPEDDRAGFMALRTAFERARNEVRWREEYGDDAGTGEDETDGPTSEAAAFPVGAVAIGDVPLAEISERTPDASSEAKPAHDEIRPYEEDEPSATEETPEDEAEESYDDDGYTPEEIAAWQPIKAALDRLTDLLTATGEPPPVKAVLAIIDGDDISSIDQYRTMQEQVRQLLCGRTNCFDSAAGMRLPGWLSLEVFDALDTYYGWSRETTTSPYVKGLNDWLVRVRRAIELETASDKARNQARLEDATANLFGPKDRPAEAERSGKGSTIWLWIGAGILISQLVQFLVRLNGGG